MHILVSAGKTIISKSAQNSNKREDKHEKPNKRQP